MNNWIYADRKQVGKWAKWTENWLKSRQKKEN